MAPAPSSSPSISIILLAAGPSSRLGQPKQLIPYQGTTLLRYLAKQAIASRASGVIVVLGSDSEKIRKELGGVSLKILENKEWKKGISSSIRIGLREARTADALLIMLCDQPFVTTALLDSMISPFVSSQKTLVGCDYASTVGVPVLFGKEFFEELSSLRGDTGAKGILLRHKDQIHHISFPSGSVDIDSYEDLKKI